MCVVKVGKCADEVASVSLTSREMFPWCADCLNTEAPVTRSDHHNI